MSLSKMLEDKSHKEFQDIIRSAIPSKNEFHTMSGKPAFSTAYTQISEYNLSNNNSAAIVGTAFDYLARTITLRYIGYYHKNAFNGSTAESGLKLLERLVLKNDLRAIRIINKNYKDGIQLFLKYLKHKVELKDIIPVACFFAKLEQFYRSAVPPKEIERYLIENENAEEVLNDLDDLCKVYETNFLNDDVLKSDSKIALNPNFGIGSALCTGADADIIIEDTLNDFKTSKKLGYNWKEVAQITGYLLLHNIAKRCKNANYHMNEVEIKRIGFYRARYGEIEYFDVDEGFRESLKETESLLIDYLTTNKDIAGHMLLKYGIEVEELEFM